MKVSFIVGGNADQLRTLPTGRPEDLTGSDTKALRKIVFGQDNTMTCLFIACHSYGFAF